MLLKDYYLWENSECTFRSSSVQAQDDSQILFMIMGTLGPLLSLDCHFTHHSL